MTSNRRCYSTTRGLSRRFRSWTGKRPRLTDRVDDPALATTSVCSATSVYVIHALDECFPLVILRDITNDLIVYFNIYIYKYILLMNTQYTNHKNHTDTCTSRKSVIRHNIFITYLRVRIRTREPYRVNQCIEIIIRWVFFPLCLTLSITIYAQTCIYHFNIHAGAADRVRRRRRRPRRRPERAQVASAIVHTPPFYLYSHGRASPGRSRRGCNRLRHNNNNIIMYPLDAVQSRFGRAPRVRVLYYYHRPPSHRARTHTHNVIKAHV